MTILKPVSWEQVRLLEQSIDSMEEQLPGIKKFIIPGGHVSAAQANVARSVCRRKVEDQTETWEQAKVLGQEISARIQKQMMM